MSALKVARRTIFGLAVLGGVAGCTTAPVYDRAEPEPFMVNTGKYALQVQSDGYRVTAQISKKEQDGSWWSPSFLRKAFQCFEESDVTAEINKKLDKVEKKSPKNVAQIKDALEENPIPKHNHWCFKK